MHIRSRRGWAEVWVCRCVSLWGLRRLLSCRRPFVGWGNWEWQGGFFWRGGVGGYVMFTWYHSGSSRRLVAIPVSLGTRPRGIFCPYLESRNGTHCSSCLVLTVERENPPHNHRTSRQCDLGFCPSLHQHVLTICSMQSHSITRIKWLYRGVDISDRYPPSRQGSREPG